MPIYKERQMSIQTEKEIEQLMRMRLSIDAKLDLLAMVTDTEFADYSDSMTEAETNEEQEV